MSLYRYLKWNNSAWRYYQMVKDIFSFVFCYNFYLIIQKIKAKFVVGENKYVSK